MPPVSSPASAGQPSLTTKDFACFWEGHVAFVRNLARKTLCRASPLLPRVVYSEVEARTAVRGGRRDDLWDVEDVVQDVALRVLEYLAKGKFLGATKEDALRFLSTLTVRAVWRGPSHRAAKVSSLDEETPAAELADCAPSVEVTAELAQVLDLLPKAERHALVAAAEGCTHEEVAAELGRSVLASRALRHRAAKAAGELLAA